MTCHDAREQLSALIDDALGAEERSAVEAHLATCAECRRELDQLRRTVGLLRAVEPERAPAGFVDRVLEAARPEPWPRRLVRALLLPWPVKLPVEAAAIVLVAVGVVYVFRASLELHGARFYDAPRGTIELRETAPPSSSDANREATRPSEATRAPETAWKQQATRTPEAAKAKEAARTRDKDQAADKQAPEQKALEKKSPEGPPAAKTAPPTQAFTEAERQSKDADERRAKLDDASRDVAKRQANVPPATP